MMNLEKFINGLKGKPGICDEVFETIKSAAKSAGLEFKEEVPEPAEYQVWSYEGRPFIILKDEGRYKGIYLDKKDKYVITFNSGKTPESVVIGCSLKAKFEAKNLREWIKK
jgi:hypothetical protein